MAELPVLLGPQELPALPESTETTVRPVRRGTMEKEVAMVIPVRRVLKVRLALKAPMARMAVTEQLARPAPLEPKANPATAKL